MNIRRLRRPDACMALFMLLSGWPLQAREAQPAGQERGLAQDLSALRAALIGGESATAALDGWCATHRAVPPGSVRAVKLAVETVRGDAALRARLQLRPGETIVRRTVALDCAGKALSRADLWYVPQRLPAPMQATLAQSDTPFGRAIRTLNFRRQILETSPIAQPPIVFTQTALLRLPGDRPLALTKEAYTGELLRPAGRRPQ